MKILSRQSDVRTVEMKLLFLGTITCRQRKRWWGWKTTAWMRSHEWEKQEDYEKWFDWEERKNSHQTN